MMNGAQAATPGITVFVPLCGAADGLERLYQSLLEQTFKNFELLIIDDGSVDAAALLIATRNTGSALLIRHIVLAGCRRHQAWNRAIAEAGGELFICVEHDDRLLPGALETFLGQWTAITDTDRYAGLQCNCRRENGELIGTGFKRTDTDNFELRLIDRVAGDKGIIYRTAALKAYSFPEFGDETVPDSILHNRVSRGLLTRCISQSLIIKERPTAEEGERHGSRQSPSINARILLFNELNYYKMPPALYLFVNSRYVQLSLLKGRRKRDIIRGAINRKPLFFAAFIVGFIEAAKSLALLKSARVE